MKYYVVQAIPKKGHEGMPPRLLRPYSPKVKWTKKRAEQEGKHFLKTTKLVSTGLPMRYYYTSHVVEIDIGKKPDMFQFTIKGLKT